jgi:DNA-directed RNA polymerase subunit RPC12/RpoP
LHYRHEAIIGKKSVENPSRTKEIKAFEEDVKRLTVEICDLKKIIKRKESELEETSIQNTESLNEFEKQIQNLKKEVGRIKAENAILERKNSELKTKVDSSEHKKEDPKIVSANVVESEEDSDLSEIVFNCETCDNKFDSEEALTIHVGENHKRITILVESIPFQRCEDSQVLTPEEKLPKLSMKDNKEETNYQCDKCDKTLKSLSSLHEHRYRHCGTCNKLFLNMVQLKKHKRSCSRLTKKHEM